MPATISFSLSTNNAGTQVKYSNAASRTPAEQFANADSSGDVSFGVSNAANVMFLITLPDGQFFRLPVLTTTSTINIADPIPIYPQGVPPGLEDITALIAVQTSSGGGITNTAPEGFGTRSDVDGNLVAEIKQYAATFSTGGDDPTVAPYLDLLPTPIVWTRTGTGRQMGAAAGAFPAGSIPTQLGVIVNSATATFGQWMLERLNDNTIRLTTSNAAGSPTDGLLTDYYISFDVFVPA